MTDFPYLLRRGLRSFNVVLFAILSAAFTPAGSKTAYSYGFSVFQWQDAFWKCPGICTETQFGIQRRGARLTEGTVGGGRCGIPVNSFNYPVVDLEHKLAWQSTVKAFAP
jgi:hypothetical protein